MQDLRLRRSGPIPIKDNSQLSELERIYLSFVVESELTDQQLVTQAKSSLMELYHGAHPLSQLSPNRWLDAICDHLPAYFA